MKYDENELCSELIKIYAECKSVKDTRLEKYFDKISEFTGLHVIITIDKDKLIICQDSCGLTGAYFAKSENQYVYIAEHPQLIADILKLTIDETVEKLIISKCYNIGNRYLPGNLTPYKEIKRLGANLYLEYDRDFVIKRFYPLRPHPEFKTEEEKRKAIEKIGDLIHNGIECCSKKWERRAISLSGGTDSKTTLACANGLYDKFSYFSFASKPREFTDAEGAKKICEKLGLKHTFYKIPETNEEISDFDFLKKLLQHNTSYFVNLADHEIRKYIFLHNLDAYDIELKSWASEVARVFLERKYQIKMPKTLSERHFSIFQTRFFGHPKLLKWSDRTYHDFMRQIGIENPLFNFDQPDMFYWEIRMSAWGTSVTSSQQIYHRVTMPMNNRKILETFLAFPKQERKNDSVHKQIIAYKNKKVLEANVDIRNLYFTPARIWTEKIFYFYRTIFYRKIKQKDEKN